MYLIFSSPGEKISTSGITPLEPPRGSYPDTSSTTFPEMYNFDIYIKFI